jgi:nucleoside 2-deoxyribosyltransferase
MTSNVIDLKNYCKKQVDEADITIANLYEVHDDTHDDCIPAIMGYMIEDDKFMLMQIREANQEDIDAGEVPDVDGHIAQTVVLTQRQLQFISAYATTFFLIEDLDEVSE